jgi:hypothetical protein
LKLGRWQEADLKTRLKGDSVKLVLAARLRAETTMTVGWIASVWRWARAVISTIPCIAGGSWAGSIQYQELTPFPETRPIRSPTQMQMNPRWGWLLGEGDRR